MERSSEGPAAQVGEESHEEGYRFVLPARAPHVAPAVFIALFGLAFVLVPALSLLAALGDGQAELRFALFTLPLLAAGALMLALALFLARGRSSLELTPEEARAIEHAGCLRWTSRRRTRDLVGVAVAPYAPGWARRRMPEGSAPREAPPALRLSFEGAEPLWAAIGYPREKLLELAGHVRRVAPELARVDFAGRPLVDEPEPRAALVEAADAPVPAAVRPPGSDIGRCRTAGGIEISVPPAGVWKGSKGLILLGLVFSLFGAGALVAAVAGGRELLPLVPFSLVFGGMGAAMVLASVSLGRRTATLRVEAGRLSIERVSLLGRRAWSWEPGEVTELRRGPSGTTINGRPVLELQVLVKGRKVLGLLSQRDDEELEWIAGELLEALTAGGRAESRVG